MENFAVTTRGDSNESYGELRRVLKAAFPEWEAPEARPWYEMVEGIECKMLDGSSGWSRTYLFLGIQLSFTGHRSRKIFKRVMVKDGQIDLDAIRAKHAELKQGLADANEANREQARKQKAWQVVEAATRKGLGLKDYDPEVWVMQGDPPTVTFSLSYVPLDKAKAILAIIRPTE